MRTRLGTDGNYGWYKMQLKDMIGYAELNEAFRHFKEFGNTIVFLNLLESALVRAPPDLRASEW